MSQTYQTHLEFLNRPAAKATASTWNPPPPPANPVVSGLPLKYLSSVVSNAGLVAQTLYQNGGFTSLRDRPELDGVEPRYDPLVIRTGSASSPNEDDQYVATLASEDWNVKTSTATVFRSTLDYHDAYKSGSLTPTDVAKALLPQVRKEGTSSGRHSTAFIQVREARILAAAAASTQRYQNGKYLSPLDGVPVAVKDEVDVAGYTKCFGSAMDFTREDGATSYCVQRWLDAGAILVGKTNMHEMGVDTTNCNVVHGTPLNPYNEKYYCGGSSGGSAYAVGAGLVPLAEGNDGGGSIRIPAAYCGVYGLKPSHGRVSSRPSKELASTTGVAGPIAANMCDLELGYRIMAQPDSLNHKSRLFAPPSSPTAKNPKRRKVLGIYKPWFDRADPGVEASCQNAIEFLTSKLGYETVDITIPLVPEGQIAHALTILSELASGVTASSIWKLQPATKILFSVGRRTTAIDFLQAQRVRQIIMQHLSYLFTTHPSLIIITPTTPNAGWPIGVNDLAYGASNANMSVRSMEYVWMANFSGCPALTAPVGFVEAKQGKGKVPIGLMGMGEWRSEDELIAFGYDCESFVKEGLEGGRVRPENWMDVLEAAMGGKAGAA
ncbi:unnamed protein product [Zymoseptoria tritici ST99CH_1E4]|uniref:Amidase domain-containing protein n=1 Tax=Zymoseptoria tritici ST99CH_1E4 TaxID=1276532 RepID=A0A2H1FKP5_ZYMTR|nr:unnamed protein product [Zymoseptoria tritici ST99CH_1E4]